jgi:hypothetical protein
MVNGYALSVALWGVVIACAIAVGAAVAVVLSAPKLERWRLARRARVDGIRAVEAHLAKAADESTVR